MKVLAALAVLVLPATALAQEPSGAACTGTCVPDKDMATMVAVLKEKQCLLKNSPTFKLDSIDIIVDKQGRIFYSGAAPHPYKLDMQWCGYQVHAEGKVNVTAAVQEPASYGFRFRPKAFMGMLLLEPFRSGKTAKSGIDAGLMIDPLYFKDFNLNFHVGFRSVGAGVGMDIFRSFGVYGGYALAWDGFNSNPEAAAWFSFW